MHGWFRSIRHASCTANPNDTIKSHQWPVNCYSKGAHDLKRCNNSLACKHQLAHVQWANVIPCSSQHAKCICDTYECVSVSLHHVFICGWATGDMRLSLTCDRNNHRSPHPWLSHPQGIIQTYNVTLFARYFTWALAYLEIVAWCSGSNWEGFDRAVVVASESRANESFEPIPRNDSVEPIRSAVFGRNKIVYDIKNNSY